MMKHCFILQPFPGTAPGSPHRVTGGIARIGRAFAISYVLFDPLQEIVLPPQTDNPLRADKLWRETCFEFFIAPEDSSRYWEFNLSQAGHWNVYRFSAYREGMEEEETISSLPFHADFQKGSVQLRLKLNLDRIVSLNTPIEVAVSSVIRHKDGVLSYWALTHPTRKADFHHRESFILQC